MLGPIANDSNNKTWFAMQPFVIESLFNNQDEDKEETGRDCTSGRR